MLNYIRSVETDFRRRLAVFMLTLGVMLLTSCIYAAPVDLPARFRLVLNEKLLSGKSDSPVHKNSISSADARKILRDNLDSELLTHVVKITSTDFRFMIPGQQYEAQIAILIVSYPDEKTALRMSEKLASGNGIFKRAQILSRFSAASIGSSLIIAFTETSGNDAVVRFINDLPVILKEKN